MQIEELYSHFLKSTGICTDTRNLVSGSIFVALKGANFNGNDFSNKAIKSGCKLAVADEQPQHPDERILVVENALATLQQLANYHRRQLKIPVIGLTGSNGKTTTKELIHAVLKKKYQVHSTKGNLNNHIGVPLTLLSISKETELAVVEMGANQPKDIKELCEIAEPDYGLITNIGEAHLQGFGDLEGVIRAKSQLFNYIRSKKGTVITNASDPLIQKLSAGIQSLTYSTDQSPADVQGELLKNNIYLSFKWAAKNYASEPVITNLVGKYNLPNLMAAVATGVLFNVEPEDISTALAGYEPQNNRSQLLKTTRNNVLLDAYNANPSSVSAALDGFAEGENDARFCILGDMFELGSFSREAHKNILQKLADYHLPGIVIGREFRLASEGMSLPEIEIFETTDSARKFLQDHKLSGQLILLKGSRGMQLEKLIDLL